MKGGNISYINIYYEKSEQKQFGGGFIHIWDDNGYKKLPYKRYAYKLNNSGTFKTLFGQNAKKVFRWSKKDEENGLIFEGDVNPCMRYLIDNYTDSEIPSSKHVVFNFDIEVDSTNTLPDINEALNKITAISYYDNVSKQYTALILDENAELVNESYDWKDNSKVNVFRFDNERTLLQKFLIDYKTINPTILTGWNIDGFDVPYLYNRLKNLFGNVIANSLSPVHIVKHNPFRGRYFIAGVSCLDYLQLYKTYVPGVMQSFKLDAVSKKELGRGKITYDGTLSQLFKTDKLKYIEYNLTDVELVKSLDDKLKFIELAKGICHKGHVPLEDAYFSSRYLDGAILTYLKLEGVVGPNKPIKSYSDDTDDDDNNDYGDAVSNVINSLERSSDDEEEGFSGAYVKNPTPGMYDWVIDLDFTSLYPSIIMTLNISPETKVFKMSDWDPMAFARNEEKNYVISLNNNNKEFSTSEFRSFLKQNNFSIASNGVIYHNNCVGVIPYLLDKWFKERVEFRALQKKYGEEKDMANFEFYKLRQYVQKILLNSLYGVLGLPIFRFYDIDNAEAVTKTGVNAIKYAESVVNMYYNEKLSTNIDHVIYIDTDSVDGNSMVRSKEYGNVSIQELFDKYDFIHNIIHKIPDNRQFVFPNNLNLPYYDEINKLVKYGKVKFIEKHHVKKRMFKIKTLYTEVIVTEDHSCMILENDKLVEKKAKDLKKNDKVIVIK